MNCYQKVYTIDADEKINWSSDKNLVLLPQKIPLINSLQKQTNPLSHQVL